MKSTDLKEALDWTSGHWSNDSLLDPELAAQFTSTLFVFSDSVQCLGGNCQEHLEAAKTWENDRTREFVQSPEYQAYYDVTGYSNGIRVQDSRGKDDD